MRSLSQEVRKQLAHGLAGLIIIIKGVDKFEHHHSIAGSLLVGIGLLVLALTIVHHRLARHIKSFDSLVFLMEAIVLSVVSFLYLQDGKKALPIAYCIASIGYLIAAFRFYRRAGQRSH
ncbi:hypothetical protein GO730_06630 [Spirosoma sp. HMF3257]|uniref:DUF2127 domain-containing protein n=1 Tax=Spirosoma telluris TaxID=2183553 RepID=A0A327NFS1_9BACT|nr:hypothetical protein [Spirosoma telluris]RAI74092.1 hypothetical protein HMF3257_06570 [Spirosoma telluris]